MSDSLTTGIFVPPAIEFLEPIVVCGENQTVCRILSIEQFAGGAVGNATIVYPASHADNPAVTMGESAEIKIGEDYLFRGVIAAGPVKVDSGRDEFQLVLFDDKWLLARPRIGTEGIGSAGTDIGFTDVGFNIVFNREDKPNKAPSTLDFNTGSTAVYWTLRDILNFLFQYYMPAGVATIAADQIAHAAYSTVPSHLNLGGQTLLQAIETVAELAGETWTLIPGETASEFRSIRPGNGTIRTAGLFKPFDAAQASDAGIEHASEIDVPVSIENCRDVYQAMSGPIHKESVYSTANGLLVRLAGFEDKEYTTRYVVDVTAYAANNLGQSLSAGSPAKPWKSQLLTRIKADGSNYLLAADLLANRVLEKMAKHVEIPVWLSADGEETNAKLCTNGYRIDPDKGTLDFVEKPSVKDDSGLLPDGMPMIIPDWSAIGVWITVATVLETRDIAESAAAPYLSPKGYEMIQKSDLIPEKRQNNVLPDLTAANPNVWIWMNETDEDDEAEDYIYVHARLQDAADRALARTPKIETPIEVTLPFFPHLWRVGDQLRLGNRDFGETGDEVIIEIRHNVHDEYSTKVRATNVMKSVDPDRFVERRK